MSAVGELVAFLRAALDEDERVAREAPGPEWIRAIERHGEPGKWRGVRAQLVTLPPERPHPLLVGTEVARSDHYWVAEHIARWDPARVLAEVEAKRARLDWLMSLEHEMPEGFPTYDSCRLLAQPGDLGDLEVGYCSCGLDGWRAKLLRFEAQPYADRPGWREEWRAESGS